MEANHILAGKSSEVLDKLLTLNGSSGGARPKIVALVSDDKQTLIHGNLAEPGYSPWLIKFASSLDNKNIGAEEYVYSKMAKDAGIEMPETYLFPSKNCVGHFGVKRFDRIGNQKVHIHTACGLLLTKDIREVEKMVRLMIFNVKAGNKDDHSKNFSFMLDRDNNWKMTPAYDLTPSQGINGEQTSMVNGKGTDITDSDLIKTAVPFGFAEKKVAAIIEQTNDALANYGKYMKDLEVK